MTTVATAEVEISASGSASVVQEFSKVKDSLKDLESGGKATKDSANGMVAGFGALKGALGALGIGLTVGALVNLVGELDQTGAAAIRAGNSLNVMTGGRADEWISKMSEATHGASDNLDLAHAATRLLTTGVATTADEAAHLIQVATILGGAVGRMTPGESVDRLTDSLNRGTTRGVIPFGVNVEILTARMKALHDANENMSNQEAMRIAFFEQADPVAAKLNSTLNDQAAHLQQLAAATGNAKDAIGEFIAKEGDPLVQATTRMLTGTQQTQAMAGSAMDLKAQIAATTPVWADYIAKLNEAGLNTQYGREGMAAMATEFQHLRAVAVSAQMEITSATRDSADSAEANAAAIADLTAQVSDVAAAVELYNKELEVQAGLQLHAEQQVSQLTGLWWGAGSAIRGTAKDIATLTDELGKATDALTTDTIAWGDHAKHTDLATHKMDEARQKVDDVTGSLAKANEQVAFGPGANWPKIFQFAAGQMGQMGLSATQLEQKYNELGLATGQVTQKQIDQGTGLRQLNNLYANGKISVDEYLDGLSHIPTAVNASNVAMDTLSKHFEAAGMAIGLTGQHLDEYVLKQMKASDATREGTTKSLGELQTELDNVSGKLAGMTKSATITFTDVGGPDLQKNLDTINGGLGTLRANPQANITINDNAPAAKTRIDAVSTSAEKLMKGSPYVIDVVINTIGSVPSAPGGATGGPGGATGGTVNAYAGGTLNFPGGWGMVGERGPEMVRLPNGSQIFSSDETKAMMSGGGDMHFNAPIYITAPDGANVRSLMQQLKSARAS